MTKITCCSGGNHETRGNGMIGFISLISDCFSDSCNGLRLTAISKTRPCLFSDISVDIKTPLGSGASDEELESLY